MGLFLPNFRSMAVSRVVGAQALVSRGATGESGQRDANTTVRARQDLIGVGDGWCE